MILTIIIASLTCVILILSVLFFPKIKIKKFQIDTYILVCLVGAILLILFNKITFNKIFDGLTSNTSVNPLKILVLFISMTYLSIYLDEIGFFKYLANIATKKAGKNQISLFIVLYLLVSVLTIFTSNDIVILTFTPFICYFCKSTKINPVPYLVSEFCAANTWSMLLMIGNPTNIYLSISSGINFIDYIKIMALPTLFAGVIEGLIMYLLFRKSLKQEINYVEEDVKIDNKIGLIIGLIHLSLCIIMLIISSYISVEMWFICLIFSISLLICTLVIKLIKKQKNAKIVTTIKRLPWNLIPFVISMFVIVLTLTEQGVTESIRKVLGESHIILNYGLSSFLSCNLINNIPMSVLYSNIPLMSNNLNQLRAIYSTIIGSNIGAFLTPIGALAGIMFSELVSKQDIKFGFLEFTKYGFIIAIPTILMALLGLSIML